MIGGNLLPPPITRLEWFLAEVDEASKQADMGDLANAARLKRAMMRDPVIAGLMATKTGGIVRLPKKWSGSETVREWLTGKDHGITRFDLLCPPQELKAMADDSDFIGVSVGELVPVEGRSYPVLERKDPEFLYYRWSTNSWHLKSTVGLLDITPGDGHWVMNFQGPRIAPWQQGKWHALGRSWVRKDSMQHLKTNWAFKLANAARVAVSPRAATKDQRLKWFGQVAAWGINSVFSAAEGWDVKLIESNGRGWEGFDSSIKEANEDFMIGLAGQLVSVTGGTGFSAEDLYDSVRFDLIRDVASPLGYTVSTQVLPAVTYDHFPEEFDDSPSFEFDVRKPSDLTAEAAIFTALGAGLDAMQEAAARAGLKINVQEILTRFGINVTQLSDGERVELMKGYESANDNPRVQEQKAILYTLGRALIEKRMAS